jgi:hypothetical protein
MYRTVNILTHLGGCLGAETDCESHIQSYYIHPFDDDLFPVLDPACNIYQ